MIKKRLIQRSGKAFISQMPIMHKKIFIFLFLGITFHSVNASPPVFELHSGFWINLHHYLYYQALLRHPTPNTRDLTFSDSADLAALTGNEKAIWQSAIEFYTNNIINKDLLFDTS